MQVQITGATTTISFASSALSGSLQTVDPQFSSSGLAFSFTVQGIALSGSAFTTNSPTPGGLITQVVVTPQNTEIGVQVKLSSPANHYEFGLGRDEVGVQFS